MLIRFMFHPCVVGPISCYVLGPLEAVCIAGMIMSAVIYFRGRERPSYDIRGLE